jgi:pyrroline-5-carboxylate reductase
VEYQTIGFLGAGNMAEAFIKSAVETRAFAAHDVLASDIRPERLRFLSDTYGITTSSENQKVVAEAQILFLSVKPQHLPEVLQGVSGMLRDDVVVVSIAAGVPTSYIAKRLGDVPIVRAMPNTPAMVSKGVAALFNRGASTDALQKVRDLFNGVGTAVVVDDEDLLDAVTAVSGSGPAYFFLLMEEMIRAGESLGLPSDVAAELVIQTAAGAAELARAGHGRGEGPAELRGKVTSKGGTTAAATEVLMGRGFNTIVNAAIKRARDRARELSEEVAASR